MQHLKESERKLVKIKKLLTVMNDIVHQTTNVKEYIALNYFDSLNSKV